MRFWTIARKDLKTLRRDKSALVFTFGMPIILTFVFGSMSGGRGDTSGTGGFKVLVANQDSGDRGAQTIQAMKDAGLRPIAETGGRAAVEAKIAKGDFVLGVIIPQDYSGKFDAALTDGALPHAELQLVADPAE